MHLSIFSFPRRFKYDSEKHFFSWVIAEWLAVKLAAVLGTADSQQSMRTTVQRVVKQVLQAVRRVGRRRLAAPRALLSSTRRPRRKHCSSMFVAQLHTSQCVICTLRVGLFPTSPADCGPKGQLILRCTVNSAWFCHEARRVFCCGT